MPIESKKSGRFGNLNAKKTITKTSQLQIRVEAGKKKEYEEAARKNGITVSEWILTALEKELKI